MRNSELRKLLDPTLHPMARSLYLALRSCVDFGTGLATVSYPRLIELISFEPSPKARIEPIRPTTKQVRVWLDALIKHELIAKKGSGNMQKGSAATWLLLEILQGTSAGHERTQQPRGVQSVAGHECGAHAGHVEGHVEGHEETQRNQGVQSVAGHVEGHVAGHISDINNINKNIYMGAPISASQLTFDDQFEQTAKLVGLAKTTEQLQASFESFITHPRKRHLTQSQTDWLADWRHWCAKAKVYELGAKKHANNQHTNKPSSSNRQNSYQNPTAQILDLCEQHARRTAGTSNSDW